MSKASQRADRINAVAYECKEFFRRYRQDRDEDDFRLAMAWLDLLVALVKKP